MIQSTVSRLRCPNLHPKPCRGALSLSVRSAVGDEVRYGQLSCGVCLARYPILAGVAILIADVGGYLLSHVKGVSRLVPLEEIPQEYRDDFVAAQEELFEEHIEEDLEAERVNALYVMTHYLRGEGGWWRSEDGSASPLIEKIIRENWDQGPFEQVEKWVASGTGDVIELGCGVAGLYPRVRDNVKSYLGVDSSFASIALGRHLALGFPYEGEIRVPADLLQGAVSRKLDLPVPSVGGRADLVVGEIQNPPVGMGEFDLSIALNAIDMLEEPAGLPQVQSELVPLGGRAIQSCPYIWHGVVAEGLRKALPSEIRDSAQGVEWLYQNAGFEIDQRIEHVPWLFFKQIRQLEIYSAHMFVATKRE